MPQPQEAVTFGLLILNWAPIRSSTKSISEPAHEAERDRIDHHAGAVALDQHIVGRRSSVTRSKRYWKPEQPPPSTLTRNSACAASAWRDLGDAAWRRAGSMVMGRFGHLGCSQSLPGT